MHWRRSILIVTSGRFINGSRNLEGTFWRTVQIQSYCVTLHHVRTHIYESERTKLWPWKLNQTRWRPFVNSTYARRLFVVQSANRFPLSCYFTWHLDTPELRKYSAKWEIENPFWVLTEFNSKVSTPDSILHSTRIRFRVPFNLQILSQFLEHIDISMSKNQSRSVRLKRPLYVFSRPRLHGKLSY